MNYQEAIEYVESLAPTQIKPGLERFSLFMSENGNPQNNCPSLHIAGTNGKGSVTCMLAQTLVEAGIKTGRYTGPHLLKFNERFEVDAKAISDMQLAAVLTKLRSLSEAFAAKHPEHGKLSWFELLTATAFFHFAENQAQASVVEVGLGGRWDASNVLKAPVVSAIVSIGLDHMHILGETESLIAAEKAGIIKEGVPLITACKAEALASILQTARQKQAPVICLGEKENFYAAGVSKAEKEMLQALKLRLEQIDIESCLKKQLGYQRQNALLSAAILAIWEIRTKKSCLSKFSSALENFFWPGRLQFIESKNLLLDGAHNESGAKALKESIDELFPKKERSFIIGFYQTKQAEQILKTLLKPGDRVFASESQGRRAVLPSAEIVRMAEALGAEAKSYKSFAEAFAEAERLDPARLKIATGSFAVLAAAYDYMGFKTVEESRSGVIQCSTPEIFRRG
ncbi:MAG: hypothetical protein K2X27_14945 [Candidatus Obscuribacterales bacterium]|nr:hypothetical protein [Candidatus Obscuribacterales bacterium]